MRRQVCSTSAGAGRAGRGARPSSRRLRTSPFRQLYECPQGFCTVLPCSRARSPERRQSRVREQGRAGRREHRMLLCARKGLHFSDFMDAGSMLSDVGEGQGSQKGSQYASLKSCWNTQLLLSDLSTPTCRAVERAVMDTCGAYGS